MKNLFGEWGPPQLPTWFAPNKAIPQWERRVRTGKHPLGAHLGPADETCGSCGALLQNTRGYWKCAKRNTRSACTDVRLKWRACAGWEPPLDGRDPA